MASIRAATATVHGNSTVTFEPTVIFNCSILSGRVPSQWLTAIVTPIPKIPQPLHYCDLRPISVTPILSRVVEKLIVNKWLRSAIPSHSIADQFAFRRTGSTTAALVYLMHHVTRFLETNSYVRCLMIDFSKAFDIVDHAIIVEKISKLSLPWFITNWLISFLCHRKIIVKFNHLMSQPRSINRSIVQGSGVGPTLYIVHESDLQLCSIFNILLKYADDTNLLVPEHTDISLADEFDNVKKWASENKMVINYGKTKEIVFRRPNPRHSINPDPIACIEQVCEAKLLGVVFNNKLAFETHVQFVLRQCNQRLYLIKLLRNQGLSRKQLNIVFQAIIVARIQYALPAWGGFISCDMKNKIDALFSRANRSGFCNTFSFDGLLFSADHTLYKAMCNSQHCLSLILPPVKEVQHDLRLKGHGRVLPDHNTALYRKSFILRHLFATV